MSDLQLMRWGGPVTVDAAAVARLERGLKGALVRPSDPGYEQARRCWNGRIDRRPGLIVRCAGAADVCAAVRFARERDLVLSVRGGGHNIAGLSLADGGVCLDLGAMTGVTVDPAARVARVEGGALLGHMDRATQAHGLATTTGVVSTTGVAALTLGGGEGLLGRKHGMACDNLLSVQLVTAEGELVTASAAEDPDLLWGLRGGGGNFGIAVALELQLHPLGPTVFQATAVHPIERAAAELDWFLGITRDLPDELHAGGGLGFDPDGNPILAFSFFHPGPAEEAERSLRPLAEHGAPLKSELRAVDYVALQCEGDARWPHGGRYYWRSALVEELPAALLVERWRAAPRPAPRLGLFQLGGVIARTDPSATAYRHRTARFDLVAPMSWESPAEDERRVANVRAFWGSLAEVLPSSWYVNNLTEEDQGRVRAAFGANYDRLLALKRRWDPDNFFRLNANVAPGRRDPSRMVE